MEPRVPDSLTEQLGSLPLTIPPELWAPLGPEDQLTFRNAQVVLDELVTRQVATLADLDRRTKLGSESIMRALHALASLELVEVQSSEEDIMARLIAVPDEHVPVVGPDAKTRWIFVARPLEAPEVEPSSLN